MDFRVGDIILNEWAGERNPTRYSMVFKKSGRYVYCWYIESKNRIGQCRLLAQDLKNNDDGKFSIIGHCDIFVKIRESLEIAMGRGKE